MSELFSHENNVCDFKASLFVVLQKSSSGELFYLLLLSPTHNPHHVFVLFTI